MAVINVEDLNLNGSELLSDQESFFDNLSDVALEKIYGGFSPFVLSSAGCISAGIAAFAATYQWGKDDRPKST